MWLLTDKVADIMPSNLGKPAGQGSINAGEN